MINFESASKVKASSDQPAAVGWDGAPRARLWTLREAADFLRVSPATVRRWTNAGVLPCYRPRGKRSRRLFSPEKILAFLAACEQGQGHAFFPGRSPMDAP